MKANNRSGWILGVSAFFHDSAASLIKDGELVFSAQEERFSRIKHDSRFPKQAIDAALKFAQIAPEDLEVIAYYEDPILKRNRIFSTLVRKYPRGSRAFFDSLTSTAVSPRKIQSLIRNEVDYTGQVYFGNHHQSHAASAFFPSPFEEAAILTMDGVGEWTTSSISFGKGNRIQFKAATRFPHSLGLLYSSFTKYCGFKVNSGEYKLMGLAPYGEPKFLDLIKKNIANHYGNGAIRLNMKYFDFELGQRMTNEKFANLFGMPPATPEESTKPFFMDIAASIQAFTEEVMMGAAKYAKHLTGAKYLCLAGGVALNCVSNGKIFESSNFQDLWIQPAAGDAGGSLGVALDYWHQVRGGSRVRSETGVDRQKASLLGNLYSEETTLKYLQEVGAKFFYYENENEMLDKVASLIAQGNVIGWFQGRSEFGPRSLGSRSILGNPLLDDTQSRMNLKIKFRESFRPFAPAVCEDEASKWFDVPNNFKSPYMLLVAKVEKSKLEQHENLDAQGLDLLKIRRSQIPAVTHVDDSARIQTVNEKDNPKFYKLINKFGALTGVPVIVNTSFNVRGEPIVESPRDAYMCFMRTEIDYLCIGQFLLDKREQKALREEVDWRNKFELD